MVFYNPLKTRELSGIERLGWTARRNFGLDFIRRPPMISVPSVPGAGFLDLPFMAVPSGVPLAGSAILVQWGGAFRLAEVKLQEGETLENALRRFKRKVQQEDIIKEVKRHSFYLKPGEKRRAKQALARKRNRKKSRREIE